MQIPFVGGAYTARSTNLNAQTSVNLFPVVDQQDAKVVLAMYGTPGLSLFVELESGSGLPLRGVYVAGSYLYAVVGPRIYSVTTGGVKALLGTITTNSGKVWMADNGIQVIVVDGTSSGYIITMATNVMAIIADTDFPAVSSVTFQDGYFIVTKTNTARIYISGLYDGTTWDALDFATAEGRPDNLLSAISNTQDLWLFGTSSVEIWYNSGAADFPFAKITGALIDAGCGAAASPTRINGILYWLSDKGQAFKNTGYAGQLVSTPDIDYRISSFTVISDAIGYTYSIDGHDFWVIAFPSENKTLVYDISTKFWHEWQSYTVSGIAWGRHRSNCSAYFGRDWIVGDYSNGQLYKIDMSIYTDNGELVKRQRACQTINKERMRLIFHELEVEFEAGVGVSGVQASATANLTGDAVTSFSIVSGGANYLSAPAVEFSGGGGTGAVATATVSGGAVTGFTILNGGSGYTVAPTVTLIGGSTDPQAILEWSDDGGHTWSNQHWTSIGKIGEYKARSVWNRLGMSRNRVFRLSIYDAVKVVILGAFAEIEECKG